MRNSFRFLGNGQGTGDGVALAALGVAGLIGSLWLLLALVDAARPMLLPQAVLVAAVPR